MLNTLIIIISAILAIYICIETILLATAPGSASDKKCFMLKCIVSACAAVMILVDGPNLTGLLCLAAIALFMWGATFYRLLSWLNDRHPLAFALIMHYLKIADRRQK